MNANLFIQSEPSVAEAWKPRPLTHAEWASRNYVGVYAWRIKTLALLRNSPTMLAAAKVYYSTHPNEFICHWMDTFDPRKSPTHIKPELRGSKWMPMVLFSKQDDVIAFFHELRQTGESGLIEKARDMGITWEACQYSVWSWLFIPSDAIGWGSRKQELVDKIGDVSSIFEKLRMLINRLPDIWKPNGLKPRDHLTFMKCINPENGSTITGETGDNIGRGGRTSLYMKDESAHYERPEKIQAALDDNTHVQIDISSVNGLGNVFHRKREAGEVWTRGCHIEPGITRVLIIDWRDHPEKTQAWYDQRKAKNEREGTQHLFAQEVDRDYSAAIQNTIIAYEWCTAAIDAHLIIPQLRIPPPNAWMAGLDVADGGIDRNALALRQWVILRHVEEWGERDPGVTMRRAIMTLRDGKWRLPKPVIIQADLIGVGSGVKTEYNRLVDDKHVNPQDMQLVFWNAGGAVINKYDHMIENDEESPINGDFFGNFKAQGWWSVRTRFYKTWKCVMAIRAGEPCPNYHPDELISIDGTIPDVISVCKELAQAVGKRSTDLLFRVDKAPDGTRSPNKADAVVQAFYPVPDVEPVLVGGFIA